MIEATRTNQPTVRSTRLRRVRSSGVKSCKGMGLSLVQFGRFRSFGHAEPAALADQSKTMASAGPEREIVGRRHNGHFATAGEWMALGQLREEIAPPRAVAGFEAGQRLVNK